MYAGSLQLVRFLAVMTLVSLRVCFAQEGKDKVKHPVLTHNIDPNRASEYESAVKRVMAMSEAEMLRLIPTKSAILFCGCPHCNGGQQDNNQFDWTIERPFELKCKYCGYVFPSDEYPTKWTATGVNALGETVTYGYYFDEKTNRDFWFEAHADYLRRAWFVSQCLALAQAYQATQKPEYARRAALILNQFAAAYPHMAVLKQWPYQRRDVVKPTPPFPWDGGKWGRWMEDEVPGSLPEAYDLICDSGELDKLSKEQGADVRKRIENDFFRAMIDYALTFGKEPTGGHLNNMAYTYTRNMINLGRIMGEPEYVHWGYRWVGNMLSDGFMFDGMWKEAPSYHYQTINGVRIVMQTLKGYSDPPGYKDAVDGLHFEDMDLESQSPFVAKALRAPDLIAYPNGRICPVHDTWAKERSSKPREETRSTLLPGYGHASLGRGRGENQLQAQLHFSGGYGHTHADNLNLSLFAKGSELLSDIGYTHTRLRHWVSSTVGHNTVVMDRLDQTMGNSDGDLLLFVPDLNGLTAVEARGERAYPKLAQVYRRLLLLVPVSDSDAYVVDIFRVKGGQTHDWLLHGSADGDMTAECSLALNTGVETMLEPSDKWVEPVAESSDFSPYGVIREARVGKSDGVFTVTFQYTTDTPAAVAPAQTGVRVHLVNDKPTEVFLGKSPRVRQSEGDDRKVYDFWMPQLIVRRRGAASLSSTFLAVHEPFKSQPFLREVRSVPLSWKSEFGVGLQVRHGEFVDTIIDTMDEPPYPERRLPGGLTMKGRIAVIRERAGQVVAAWLIDGERVAKWRFVLAGKTARCEGIIESSARKADGATEDALVTAATLASGNALSGQWIIVTHGNGSTHGYEVDRVEQRGGKSVLVLRDDPGLRISGDKTEECYFPRRVIQGLNRFRIAGSAQFN
ncbi:MAG: heparinase II/III family protein [Armatimonadetes bacterium]|nr:heparinase II/III family protein [Armatimonadota bacterium]